MKIQFVFILMFGNFVFGVDISSISIHEQQIIERLFHKLFFLDDFVYTLNEVKPLAYSCYPKNFMVYKNLNNFEAEIMEMGSVYPDITHIEWRIWKKNSAKFPMKKFVIIEDKRNGFECVFLIHKPSFIKCCDDHILLFKEILGEKFNSNKFLNDLENESYSLFKSIKQSDTLFGILLGYGEKNCIEFEKECWGLPRQIPRKILDRDLETSPLKSVGGLSNTFLRINPLCFVGILDDKETISLAELYSQKHAELNRKYREPHFLELILSELTEE